MTIIDKINLLDDLFKYKTDFVSLNSIPENTMISKLSKSNRLFGVFWRQFFRISPINLRPVFDKNIATTSIDPQTTIIVALSYLELWELFDQKYYYEQFKKYYSLIVTQYKSNKYYHFSIAQKKKLFLTSYETSEEDVSPLLTCYAGKLFLRAYEITKNEKYLTKAKSVGKFFINEMPKIYFSTGIYFQYIPGMPNKIYNCSAEISSFLVVLSKFFKNYDFYKVGFNGLRYIASQQNQDGSWFYGEKKSHKYIDNFHTAYILLSLYNFINVFKDKMIENSFEKGFIFYKKKCFAKFQIN